MLQVIPESLPRLGTAPPPVSPRLLTSEKAASALLQRVALLAAGEEKAAIQRPPHDTTTSSTIALTTHQCDKDVKSVATKSVASRLMDINWSDPNVVVVSPINLLLPLPPEGVHVSNHLIWNPQLADLMYFPRGLPSHGYLTPVIWVTRPLCVCVACRMPTFPIKAVTCNLFF